MELGAFSISLPVRDLTVSLPFYEALGFARIGGEPTQGWVILRNGPAVVGLFVGMVERPTLTFNPGWTDDQAVLDSFTDVREIRDALTAAGLSLQRDLEPGGSGPDWISLTDPDGHPILVDQHVDRPT